MNSSASVRHTADVAIIDVAGRISLNDGLGAMRTAIREAIDAGDKKILLNLAEVSYIDSAGLGVLVSLSKRIRESDATLRLANLNEDLRTLFELTKLDTLFSFGGGDGLADSGVTADLAPKPRPAGGAAQAPRDDDLRPDA